MSGQREAFVGFVLENDYKYQFIIFDIGLKLNIPFCQFMGRNDIVIRDVSSFEFIIPVIITQACKLQLQYAWILQTLCLLS